MPKPFGWLDVQRIAEELADRDPKTDPYSVRFTDLRKLVEQLPGFTPDPKHPVNEKILETIQVKWAEEKEGMESEQD